MKIGLLTLGVLVIGVVAVFAMSDVYVSGTWRYKMTVEVKTPEGIKTGSAVHEISNSATSIDIMSFPESGNPATFRGEAVVIEMGEGKPPLFAIRETNPEWMFYYTFPTPDDGATTVGGIKYYKNLESGTQKTVNPKYYPRFVTFTDMDDARTVTIINNENIKEFYGDGFHINNIKITITNEPIPKPRILEGLPKFDDEFWKWLKTLKYGDPKRISGANF